MYFSILLPCGINKPQFNSIQFHPGGEAHITALTFLCHVLDDGDHLDVQVS